MDPVHHVLDEWVCGVNASGGFVWLFRNTEALAAFEPKQYGYFQFILTKHMIGVVLIALLVLVIMTLVARKAKASVVEGRAPRGRFVNLFEVLVLYVRNEMILPNMGERGVKYIPIFMTFFFYILFCNLLGLIPGLGTVTGSVMVTAGLAVIVLFMLLVLGSIEQGGPHIFLKNLIPPGVPIPLMPLMFVVEFLGPFIKCGALCIRLFANMIAGHLIIASLLGLGIMFNSIEVGVLGLAGALAMSLFEVFICVLQAYIFTLLSIIFFGAAIHPEH